LQNRWARKERAEGYFKNGLDLGKFWGVCKEKHGHSGGCQEKRRAKLDKETKNKKKKTEKQERGNQVKEPEG